MLKHHGTMLKWFCHVSDLETFQFPFSRQNKIDAGDLDTLHNRYPVNFIEKRLKCIGGRNWHQTM